MIPYASCVCFKRRRQWKLVTAQRGTSMDVREDDSYIHFRGSEDSLTSVLSTSEMCMLEALGKVDRFPATCGEQEVRVGVRRSRQPVITRLLHLHVLDDTYAGVTSMLLSKCNSWSFNTFNLDVSTGGRSLSYLLVHLFQEYGFVRHFHLDIVKVWHCFNLMEAAYHRHNPYHNSVHAADVTQAMHCFLQENKFSAYLTPLEAMASVIAAVAHDLDHPGVTQAFLVATSNHLVNLYHNSSVLENHHWRTAISCLSESGIFSHLEKDVWLDIQRQIRSLILATDITRQKEFLAKFKSYLNSECLDMEQTHYRHFALQIALKCADLCNPCRPWAISQRWSYQVCQEFYRQGAYERQLKLPLTPTFDCSRTKVAKIQADFFQFVVSPLFETWDHFLQTPLSSKLLENLHHNHSQWQKRMEIVLENDSESNSEALDAPEIKIETCSMDSLISVASSEDMGSKKHLSADNFVIKSHRSKSDSGLTPRLLPPNAYMETYSTEELHPSTTLLSLSSITNTVQLRKVYAATKVERHLICPTVFQPIFLSSKSKESIGNSPPFEGPSVTETEINAENAQTSIILTCPDGCGTPPSTTSGGSLTKQRSQSLINDSELMKYYSQVIQSRRASDFGPYSHKFSTGQKPTSVFSNKPLFSTVQNNKQSSSLCNKSTIESLSRSYINNVNDSNDKYSNVCPNNVCSADLCTCENVESYHNTPSWCWHISRSFSEERPIRPSQDFDSPLPSWQGSSSSVTSNVRSGRRGSAPVADTCGNRLSKLEEIGRCKTSGRRWSVPSETISGHSSPVASAGNGSDSTPDVGRRSRGIVETSGNRNERSSAFEPDAFGRNRSECIASQSERVVTRDASWRQSPVRRSSLPSELSNVPRLSLFESDPFWLLKNGRRTSDQCNFLKELSVLIHCTRGLVGGRPRFGSTGLETLSGIRESRTSDVLLGVNETKELILEKWVSIDRPRRGSEPLNMSLLSSSSADS